LYEPPLHAKRHPSPALLATIVRECRLEVPVLDKALTLTFGEMLKESA
jgi:hypothetical protein